MNPRRSCPLTRFRGVLLRPLGHATGENYTGGSVRHRTSRRAPNSGTTGRITRPVNRPVRSPRATGSGRRPTAAPRQHNHAPREDSPAGRRIEIISSVPADQAGAASAISETPYELGAVLGTAVLGGILTATYSARVVVPAGLSPAQAASATEPSAVRRPSHHRCRPRSPRTCWHRPGTPRERHGDHLADRRRGHDRRRRDGVGHPARRALSRFARGGGVRWSPMPPTRRRRPPAGRHAPKGQPGCRAVRSP